MNANGDKQDNAKWTDETLSMHQRHELLVEELARVAHRPHAAAGSQQHGGSDAPARESDGEQHAG